MKTRFSTLDIAYLVHELRQKLTGLRVDQIYDIDKKTYLIRFVKSGEKKMLLVDSGTRFHTTQFEWPKNPAPSGFTMKLRKHLNNKRLEKIEQVGADRIVHMQFGTDTMAYHLFLELYDKGNLILTDYTFTILHLVRPRVAGEERLAAHEKYAWENAKQTFAINREQIEEVIKANIKPSGTLRELFLSKVEFGPALFSHVLRMVGLTPQTKIAQLVDTEANLRVTIDKLDEAFCKGVEILTNIHSNDGIIVLKQSTSKDGDQAISAQAGQEQPLFYDEFHPSVIAESFADNNVSPFESFDIAVDEFFSKIEAQKSDLKQLNQEKEAIKKLEKVKLGQKQKIEQLKESQELDKQRAEVIMVNQSAVDMAISTIRKLVASQIPWDTIEEQLTEARSVGDPLASMISKLNLKQSKITLKLSNVYDEEQKPLEVDIDMNVSAFANASKYFDMKKNLARKEIKALESQDKAIKATERKTMGSLKEAAAIHTIKKARKVMWFEKFRWFVTSENYLVLGGRDAQQNELLVKKYMKPRDVYMHADAHGAPTLIIKNDTPNEELPPKTLNEAGVFAVSCSGAWDNKVISSSWWVWGDQVSKSAPTGEYLPTGSFMIRGKKNYLPAYQLVLGFGLLFRLTEDCFEKHKNERSRRNLGNSSILQSVTEKETEEDKEEDIEEEEESAGSEEEFPDTQINLNLDGDKVRTRLSSSMSEQPKEEEEYFVTTSVTSTILASAQRMKNKQKKMAQKAKAQAKSSGDQKGGKNKTSVDTKDIDSPSDSPAHKAKRGQHGRKKKLKQKYAHQDEEEREMKMRLLRAGEAAIHEFKASTSAAKSEASEDENASNQGDDDKNDVGGNDGERDTVTDVGGNSEQKQLEQAEEQEPEPDPEDEEAREGETELDVLKTLTGSPLDDDELLYAVPVVAPYSTLQNYKFRIKMMPGSTKRGKAAKSALEFFLRDKEALQREKDLIKALKDIDIARNLPGKVKLSNIVRDKK